MNDSKNRCRWCFEDIQLASVVCPHCGRDQNRLIGIFGRTPHVIAVIALVGSAFSWYAAHQEVESARQAVSAAEAAVELSSANSDRLADLLRTSRLADWRMHMSETQTRVTTYAVTCTENVSAQATNRDFCGISLRTAIISVASLVEHTPRNDQQKVDSSCSLARIVLSMTSISTCDECKNDGNIAELEQFVVDAQCKTQSDISDEK